MIKKATKGGMLFYRYLSVKDYGNDVERTRLAAQELLQQESDARGFTRNKCTLLLDGNLEMDIGKGYKMRFAADKLDLLRPYSWHVQKHTSTLFYAMTQSKIDRERLVCHRLLMNAKKGEVVDHIRGTTLADGVTLDNTTSNLRLVSHRVNCQNQKMRKTNKTGIMGVYEHKYNGKLVGYGATWRDETGKTMHKTFRFESLGHEEALERAIRCRHEHEETLNIDSRRRLLKRQREEDDDSDIKESPSKHARIALDQEVR
jgi:hypothetical protein